MVKIVPISETNCFGAQFKHSSSYLFRDLSDYIDKQKQVEKK